ncbi:transcriptional regulator [Mycobacterium phage Gaia]|uniref:Transcriptional regulator n=1 Tax=Mycobacterium phage Gaia TaxID=1486472 RepID=A0A068F1R4_9CAUD|nr:transcriptional regulator [Mycobacterium phage Gaia]AID58887.1 transcriptional regulator [Mycobacterium phage Gaia]AYR00007.1 immunity repressor [Mycobacterium phage Nebkiss]
MARTDRETGYELQKFLVIEVFKGELQVKDIQAALGRFNQSYYLRAAKDDYPSADEIDLIAEGLDLESVGMTAGELKLRFGLVNEDQVREMEEYLRQSHPTRLATRKGARRGAQADLKSERRTNMARNSPL